jgi:hypothetical protein
VRCGFGELFLNLIQDLEVQVSSPFSGSSLNESCGDGLHNLCASDGLGEFLVSEILDEVCAFLDDFCLACDSGGNSRSIRPVILC